MNFDKYKDQSNLDQVRRAECWNIAVGLQQIDDLTPSKYLFKVAKDNIEGKVSINEASRLIFRYYKEKSNNINEREREADEVSVRIVKALSSKTFSLSPDELISIHLSLFAGVFDSNIAGKIRTYDISKKEDILHGDSVIYCDVESILDTLNYDFDREKKFKYKGLSEQKKAERIAAFASGIWQIHPFGDGNTRAVMVFIIKYLRAFGIKINSDMFKSYSKYLKNALVRSNYQNPKKNIKETNEYLNKFFRNLILNEQNILDEKELTILKK